MPEPMRIDHLSAAEIRTALAADGDLLSEEQALAIQDFIGRVGGVENARRAVQMLAELEQAA